MYRPCAVSGVRSPVLEEGTSQIIAKGLVLEEVSEEH